MNTVTKRLLALAFAVLSLLAAAGCAKKSLEVEKVQEQSGDAVYYEPDVQSDIPAPPEGSGLPEERIVGTLDIGSSPEVEFALVFASDVYSELSPEESAELAELLNGHEMKNNVPALDPDISLHIDGKHFSVCTDGTLIGEIDGESCWCEISAEEIEKLNEILNIWG